MRQRPNIMIVADPNADLIAVKEAKKLGIKVIGIVDTNTDPNLVDVAIPANDDSIKSVTLIITILADAIAVAKNGAQLFAYQDDAQIKLPEELIPEWKQKRNKRFNNPRTKIFNLNTKENIKQQTNIPKPAKPVAEKKLPVSQEIINQGGN